MPWVTEEEIQAAKNMTAYEYLRTHQAPVSYTHLDVYKRQVLSEEGARAVLTPAKENVRQNGRRMKEPEEPMFTITATDRHGILYHGRIRRLVPRECCLLYTSRLHTFHLPYNL